MLEKHTINPISSPLSQSVLIEASAGTGKTYTISTLVLRFLLGIHTNGVFYALDQLLIVTFTKAATEELKQRIYDRIIAMRSALERGTNDTNLIALIEALTLSKREALNKLIQAERTINEASIFTIHAFCQHLLFQNPIESHLSFRPQIEESLEGIRLKAVQQFWRQECYYFSPALAEIALNVYQSPEALSGMLRPYLDDSYSTPYKFYTRDSLEAMCNDLSKKAIEIKSLWQQHRVVILRDQLNEENREKIYSKHSKKIESALFEIESWCMTPSTVIPESISAFSQIEINSQIKASMLKKEAFSIEHPFFEWIDLFLTEAPSKTLQEALLYFAKGKIDPILSKLKKEDSILGYNDFISYAYERVHDSSSPLIHHFRMQYKVALIDEFQDTDDRQFSIFKKLFLESDSHTLLMIGDPKQSIYKFRGADINTYLSAKKEANYLYTLDTNYRSSYEVVSGINHFFSINDTPFYHQDIPFLPVKTPDHAKTQFIEIDHKVSSGVQLMHLAEKTSNGRYLPCVAQFIAEKILNLIEKGTIHDQGISRSITTNDITILVRKATDAKVIQEALSAHKIPSAYLAEKENIFTTQVAKALLKFLKSLLSPQDHGLMRQVFAGVLYQLSLEELNTLLTDPDQYELRLLERNHLVKLWERRGVLPMLHYFWHQDNRFRTLKMGENGERIVTDLQHLAEVLHHESVNHPTQEGLVQWFEKQYQNALNDEGMGKETTLRLESEMNVVKLMTIHASKGLEFPIVFVPSILIDRTPELNMANVKNDTQGEMQFVINPPETFIENDALEEKSENSRLYYVAMTRAKYQCYLGVIQEITHAKGVPSLNYLLNQKMDKEALSSLPFIEYNDISLTNHEGSLTHKTSEDAQFFVAVANPRHRIPWRLTSFSHLSRMTHSIEKFEPIISDENNVAAELKKGDEVIVPSQFTFPKGAAVGTFIHALFEELSPNALRDPVQIKEKLNHAYLSENVMEAIDQWSEVLADWMAKLLETALSPQFTFEDALSNHLQHELEFVFPIHEAISCDTLNSILSQYRAEPSHLQFDDLQGMLKGFIDLTFEWEGKFYIIDYKTNYLGDQFEDYHQDQLKIAMESSYYDLQYLIYTVALSRFLKFRRPSFNYERDFGGVYYLFIRGMQPSNTTGIYYNKPSAQLIDTLDQFFRGGH